MPTNLTFLGNGTDFFGGSSFISRLGPMRNLTGVDICSNRKSMPEDSRPIDI